MVLLQEFLNFICLKYLVTILIVLLLCGCRHKANKLPLTDDALIELLKANDEKLPTPKPGDWLYQYNEPGQTFEQYKATNPVKPAKDAQTIYLQPIGQFSEEQKKVIQFTADYLQVFFCLKTVVLNAVTDSLIPSAARRMREGGSEQLLAPYIIDSILPKFEPADAIAVMAVTAKDLYPESSWNYVFGEASYEKRVGVSSIYRYSAKALDSLNFSLCLERLIQTSSHEICHMFSFRHCTNAMCVMNGSNSLSESDAQPDRLCSECLLKLHWDIGFTVMARLNALKHYFEEHKLDKGAAVIEKDINLIDQH